LGENLAAEKPAEICHCGIWYTEVKCHNVLILRSFTTEFVEK